MDYPDTYQGRVRLAIDLLSVRGWTGADIARRLGIARSQVLRWHRGAAPDNERPLAELLGIDPGLVRYGSTEELRAALTNLPEPGI